MITTLVKGNLTQDPVKRVVRTVSPVILTDQRLSQRWMTLNAIRSLGQTIQVGIYADLGQECSLRAIWHAAALQRLTQPG